MSDSASSLALRSSAFAAAHSPHFLSRPAFERVFSLEPRNWPPPTNLAPEPRYLSTSALCVCCSAACSDCSSLRSRLFSWSALLDASTCSCTALSVTTHASTFAAGCIVLRGEEGRSVSWEGPGRRLGTCPVTGRSLSGRSYVIVGGDSSIPALVCGRGIVAVHVTGGGVAAVYAAPACGENKDRRDGDGRVPSCGSMQRQGSE
eukprot:scaffold15274_cov33-Phaeocystis_antarctica.AAC.2